MPRDRRTVNSHYAVAVFAGDPTSTRPEPDLHGQPPSLQLLASGTEEFCRQFMSRWVSAHPLRAGETVEVLRRDPDLVRDEPPSHLGR